MAKKALLIGINYVGTSHKLRGCANDILAMNKNFQADGFETILMSDDIPNNPSVILPTKQNIIFQLNKLISEAQAGDTIVLEYSGHGMEIKVPGDTSEKQTNCIVPTGPIDPSNLILSTQLREILVQLNSDANFFAFMDCCHSGSILKLKHNLDPQTRGLKTHGNLAMISGCQDRQTSADAVVEGKPQGALTGWMLSWLKTNALQSVFDICFSNDESKMRGLQTQAITWLQRNGFEQRPNIAYETPADSIALLSPPPSPMSVHPTVGILPPVEPTQPTQTFSAPRPQTQPLMQMYPGQPAPFYSQHPMQINNGYMLGNQGYPYYGYASYGQSFHPAASNHPYPAQFGGRSVSMHQPLTRSVTSGSSAVGIGSGQAPGMYFAYPRNTSVRGMQATASGYPGRAFSRSQAEQTALEESWKKLTM